MTKLAKGLAALATMPVAQLRSAWTELEGGAAPSAPAPLLRRLIAQLLQEKRYGALPALVARELERAAASANIPMPSPPRSKAPLSIGTRLIREWNGRTISVEVQADGFLWDERRYRSLSEVARAVTGAHWSGPRFFGLTRRG